MYFFKPGADIFKGAEINVISVANSPASFKLFHRDAYYWVARSIIRPLKNYLKN